MGGILGSKPKADPNLAKQQAEAERKAKADKAAAEAKKAEESRAKRLKLRGARSLLSNDFVGFGSKQNLGE